MPAMLTHIYCAKRILEKNEKAKSHMTFDGFDMESYLQGSQGADFLFFHKPLSKDKRVSSIGTRMHLESVYELFTASLDYIEKTNCDIAKSYMLGYVAHYALDTTAHPFVYFIENRARAEVKEKNKKDGIHEFIEADIDTYMANQIESKKVGKVNLKKMLVKDKQKISKLASMFAYIIKQIFPEVSVTQKELESAFKYMRKWIARTRDRFYLRRPVLKAVEKIIFKKAKFAYIVRRKKPNYSYFNTYKATWHNPKDPLWMEEAQENNNNNNSKPTSNDSFLELFDKAADLGVTLIEKYTLALLGGEAIKKSDFGKSFDTGLIIE